MNTLRNRFIRQRAKTALLGFAALLLLWRGSGTLSAQARPTASGPGDYISVGGGVSAFQVDYGKRVLGGGVAFVDVHPHWRVGLEGEARWLRLNQAEDVTETTYLGGVHVALRPWGLQPYVKLLAGAGTINLPFNYAHGTFLTVAPGGGVSYWLNDRVAVRIVDFEYQMWRDFPYGELRPYGISTGISFRVNGPAKIWVHNR